MGDAGANYRTVGQLRAIYRQRSRTLDAVDCASGLQPTGWATKTTANFRIHYRSSVPSSNWYYTTDQAEQAASNIAAVAENVRTKLTGLFQKEPLSDAKRAKLARHWGARVFDTFGMTEAGMMGAEDEAGGGFRIWTDMFLIEVLDPQTLAPVGEGEVGTLVVTPLWTNNVTPFLRWSSGDLVSWRRGEEDGRPYSVFPRVKHAHRTTGFFKVRGISLNHADMEDFMFTNAAIGDFKAEVVSKRDLDVLVLSIEVRRDADGAAVTAELRQSVKDRFELTPEVAVLETGTLAKEFEASVKSPRFVDRRQ